jgi:hypothetical protein
MLGPVRFTHIQDCAREVCKVFRVEDEMQDRISMLQSLDDILADLRSELASAKGASSPQDRDSKSEARSHPAKDYSALRKSLDVAKARRQISAREKSIESVKKLINEKHLSAHAAPGQSFTVSCRDSRLIYLLASFINVSFVHGTSAWPCRERRRKKAHARTTSLLSLSLVATRSLTAVFSPLTLIQTITTARIHPCTTSQSVSNPLPSQIYVSNRLTWPSSQS